MKNGTRATPETVKSFLIPSVFQCRISPFGFFRDPSPGPMISSPASRLADVLCGCRPGDQTRLLQLPQIDLIRENRLCRVGSDNFQVLAIAKREKGIPCSDAGMAASDDRVKAGLLFHECQAPVKVCSSEQQVIHDGH
jgi:hypothetical protein